MRRGIVRTGVIGIVVAGLMTLPEVLKAVLVAPHAVFMSDRNRAAELTLVNTGTEPEEVSIALVFGYPDNPDDDSTRIEVRLFGDTASHPQSAAGWIRAFPRRTIVPPGQRQIVRLLATPPRDLPDGEYWSRILVTARGARIPVAAADDGASAGLTLEVRTILSLNYRRGNVEPPVVDLDGLTLTQHGDSLLASVWIRREGNAAILGQLHLDLVNAADSTVATLSTPVAVYDDALFRQYMLPFDGTRGRYALRATLDTRREDLSDANLLRFEPAVDSVTLVVPSVQGG